MKWVFIISRNIRITSAELLHIQQQFPSKSGNDMMKWQKMRIKEGSDDRGVDKIPVPFGTTCFEGLQDKIQTVGAWGYVEPFISIHHHAHNEFHFLQFVQIFCEELSDLHFQRVAYLELFQ